MSKILTEISAGELLDKLSILEIKLDKIKNPALLQEIKKEYNIINETKTNIPGARCEIVTNGDVLDLLRLSP